MAAIKNSLMKSRSPQTLSCILRLILLLNFSFGLINFVHLLTMFFIQRFLTFFISFIKTCFFNVFLFFLSIFLLLNFSFGLINFVHLLTMFFIQRFLTFFISFIKTCFFNVFLFLGSTFLYLCAR